MKLVLHTSQVQNYETIRNIFGSLIYKQEFTPTVEFQIYVTISDAEAEGWCINVFIQDLTLGQCVTKGNSMLEGSTSEAAV